LFILYKIINALNRKILILLADLQNLSKSESADLQNLSKPESAWPQTSTHRLRFLPSTFGGLNISGNNTVPSQESNSVYANFNLKVGTFNIHGQGNRNQVKLRKICNLFTRGNFDILLLQETRTDGSEKELKKWQKIFHSKQIYLSNFGTRSVGAGIVIKNEDSFKVHQCFNDPQGRFVGVVGDHEEGKFLILSFYSPSVENEIKDFVVNSICAQLTSMDIRPD
jgi:hypothetical protein